MDLGGKKVGKVLPTVPTDPGEVYFIRALGGRGGYVVVQPDNASRNNGTGCILLKCWKWKLVRGRMSFTNKKSEKS